MSGVPLEVVQKMLRHTDPKITAGVYGHLLMNYQREAIAKARLVPSEVLSGQPAKPHGAALAAPDDVSLVTYLLPESSGQEKGRNTRKKALSFRPSRWSGKRDSDPRPSAWEIHGGAVQPSPTHHKRYQPTATSGILRG